MSFIDNLSIGQYIPANSPVHRLDPRAKIIGLICFLIGIFWASSWYDWLIWWAILIAVLRLARLPVRTVLRSVRPVVFLVVLTMVLNLFWAPGEVLWRWKFLKITDQGIRLAIVMSMRLLLLVLYANLLTLTTRPMELSDGLERLFSPLKAFGFPAHELAMMMTIALRFIPTLLGEADRIMKAQVARGADLDSGSFFKRVKAFLPVLVPLFVIVFQRADDLAVAMESRCYRGGEGRTRMKPFCWNWADSACLAFCLAAAVGQIGLRLALKGA
ncbi:MULTISPECIES: energy-coupling factor transporter transmembrane component T family protein [Jonquetella]|uniref:ABC-type cobalt transport system, permease component CbiQ n=1 Tax=Jonquetella anthropi DSM 22815 TaxID=885272 RepID=H0UL73_9BACT|nr:MULTISPECIES: energy-coupling factor transporter transmembrane component T [Jonquetella]EEX47995.1 cobalt transport protein [Jonquetella anthropi E3_33 E1]EHM13432.1 ABC-type cobalt transport system, permease component CbiQ [Jonquetella anthropi DSM 22815]ERL24327.1 cobalt transport protein [Jonquetella sp. BV3C21]